MTAATKPSTSRFRRLAAVMGRRPVLWTAITGFVGGFTIVALWLLPGVFSKTESAVPNVVGLLYDDAAARLKAAGFTVNTGESLFHHCTCET